MTVVRPRDAPSDGTAPLLLTAYGAYGQTLDADFSLARLPLLARGWGVALAHVRGGGELGRRCVARPGPGCVGRTSSSAGVYVHRPPGGHVGL